MEIIKSMFGKETGITESELRSLVGTEQETSIIECKRLVSKSDIHKLVIEPLIGFLNKVDNSGGLLLLGFKATKGKIEDIEPLTDQSLHQDKLRDRIRDSIRSIPSVTYGFSYDVIEVNVNSGFVILIEAHRTNPNAVFYSKSENQAYIRRADSTIRLEISELFQIAELRNYPIVFPVLNLTATPSMQEILYFCPIQVLIRNVGTAPGRDIIGTIDFTMKGTNHGFSISSIKGFKVSHPGNGDIPRLEFDVFQPSKKPSYPNLDLVAGNFLIYIAQGEELEIQMRVYESRGLSMTTATLINGILAQSDPEYTPYLM